MYDAILINEAFLWCFLPQTSEYTVDIVAAIRKMCKSDEGRKEIYAAQDAASDDAKHDTYAKIFRQVTPRFFASLFFAGPHMQVVGI